MRNESTYGNGFFSIVKGTGLALAISLLATIVFAAVLRSTNVPDKAIYPVNQTIKVLSLFIGVLAFTRGEKGWLKGMGTGLLFTGLSYLAFAALGGDFSLSFMIIAELLLAIVVGALSGIIAVNVKKNS